MRDSQERPAFKKTHDLICEATVTLHIFPLWLHKTRVEIGLTF